MYVLLQTGQRDACANERTGRQDSELRDTVRVHGAVADSGPLDDAGEDQDTVQPYTGYARRQDRSYSRPEQYVSCHTSSEGTQTR
jgi:hypothetical protein